MNNDNPPEVDAREHASVMGMSANWSGEDGSDAVTSDKDVVGNEDKRLVAESGVDFVALHEGKNSEPCDVAYDSSHGDQETAVVAAPAAEELPRAAAKGRDEESAFITSAVKGRDIEAASEGGGRDRKAGTALENYDIATAAVEVAVGDSHIDKEGNARSVGADDTDIEGKKGALHGTNRRPEATGDGGDSPENEETMAAAVENSDAVQLAGPPAVENDNRDGEAKSVVQDSDPDEEIKGAAAKPTALDNGSTNAVANAKSDHETPAATVAQGDSDAEEERECRVCRGDDEGGTRPLANPCACSGSVKYVHQVRATVQGQIR